MVFLLLFSFFTVLGRRGRGEGNLGGHACRKLCSDFELTIGLSSSSVINALRCFSYTLSQSVRGGAFTSHDCRIRYQKTGRYISTYLSATYMSCAYLVRDN